jgi:predicted transcriptional regulator
MKFQNEADFNENNVPSRGRYPFPSNKDDKYNIYFDPRFKRILWFLFASTRGGSTRAKIMSLINEMPANSNQISTNLNLNYKTVIHHLNVLIKNGLIITDDREIYGSTYFLTPLMEQNFQLLEQILEKVRKI